MSSRTTSTSSSVLQAAPAGYPNVLIVLDNTSNWDRASQHWPDNAGKQGQAEVLAMRTVID